MSLKAFHVVFIAASSILSFVFAAWCFGEASGSENPFAAVAGGAAAVVGVGLLIYGVRFLRRARSIGYL